MLEVVVVMMLVGCRVYSIKAKVERRVEAPAVPAAENGPPGATVSNASSIQGLEFTNIEIHKKTFLVVVNAITLGFAMV